MTCAGLLSLHPRKPLDPNVDAPCRSASLPGSRRVVPRNQEPFPRQRTKCHRLPGSKRLPPTGPATTLPLAGAQGSAAMAATGTSALPPQPSFRHAFTHTEVRARPAYLAGYSPELAGHVPPIDFCSCQDPRARPTLAKPNPFGVARRPFGPSHPVGGAAPKHDTSRAATHQGSTMSPSDDGSTSRAMASASCPDLPRCDRLGHPLSLACAPGDPEWRSPGVAGRIRFR